MTHEQMIAWLALEGWEPWKLRREVNLPMDAISVLRGDTRILHTGRMFAPTSWVDGERRLDKEPAEWSEFTNSDLETIYEKARML